jgi:hypothetical protein
MPVTTQSIPTLFVGVIDIDLKQNPLSLNGRLNRYAKARLTRMWRGFVHLSAGRWPALAAVDVTLTWYVTTNHRRDEDNLYGLLKPLADGLVDAGVVPDDTADYMSKTCRIERAAPGEVAHMKLRVVERR